MPQPVAELQLAQPAVRLPELVLVVQVGDVGDVLAHAQDLVRHRGLQHRLVHLAEVAGEGDVLLLGQVLVGKDQHGVGPERLLQRFQHLRRQRARKVDVADLGGEILGHGLNGQGHGTSSSSSRRRTGRGPGLCRLPQHSRDRRPSHDVPANKRVDELDRKGAWHPILRDGRCAPSSG